MGGRCVDGDRTALGECAGRSGNERCWAAGIVMTSGAGQQTTMLLDKCLVAAKLEQPEGLREGRGDEGQKVRAVELSRGRGRWAIPSAHASTADHSAQSDTGDSSFGWRSTSCCCCCCCCVASTVGLLYCYTNKMRTYNSTLFCSLFLSHALPSGCAECLGVHGHSDCLDH